MQNRYFAVDIYCYKDGTLAVTSQDISGLVLEAASFRELYPELLRVARRLLRSNHGLTEEQASEAELHASLHDDPSETNLSSAPEPGPRLIVHDRGRLAASRVWWDANGG